MNLHIGIPLLMVLTLIQSAIVPHMTLLDAQPDLVVLAVFAWATLDRGQEGMVWAFVGGLFLDLLSGAPLGMSSLLLTPLAYLVGLTEAQVYRNNILLPLILTAFGSLAYHIGYIVLLSLFAGYPIDWSAAIRHVTLPSVVFNVALIIPALRLMTGWYDRTHPHRVSI